MPDDRTVCTFRDCGETEDLTAYHTPNGAQPWYGCKTHGDAMYSALSVGLGQSSSVSVVDVLEPVDTHPNGVPE